MRVSENGEGELAAMTAVQMMFLLATFLCSLVAGLLFTFAYVVMPGIAKLDDTSFLRAFQAIDRVIQNNQPVFLFVWLGLALALIAGGVMSVWELGGTDRLLAIGAALVYVFDVQLPRATINVPLNNKLQKLELAR